MPGSFFSCSPILGINQAAGSQDTAKKPRHSFGGAERRAKPSKPIKALSTTYLHKCIQKKNCNFQSSKSETLLFEILSRRKVLYAAAGVGKTQGLTPAACWAPGLLLSHGCPLLPKPLYLSGICKKEKKKAKKKK